jgi:hypothetical protein
MNHLSAGLASEAIDLELDSIQLELELDNCHRHGGATLTN